MSFLNKTISFIIMALLLSCKAKKVADIPNLDNLVSVKENAEKTISEVKEVTGIKEVSITKENPKIQQKYADILGVSSQKIVNIELFEFIDSWIGTPYKLGGENRSGIDCSFFTQFLFHDVYNNLIERTAEKQYSAPNTSKFIGQEYIRQGDLLFFNLSGSQYDIISHVGVYLGNNKFVHSTSRKASTGKNGVQISNLKNPHWQKLFVAAGRKPNIKLGMQ